jgi:uncharacterized membrane protein YgcG
VRVPRTAGAFRARARRACIPTRPFVAWRCRLRGALYIVATLCGACLTFAVGRAVLGVALRAQRLRRALIGGRALPSSSRLLRALLVVVSLAWLWVLVAPAGAVFDPHAVHAARAAAAAAAAAADGGGAAAAAPPPTARARLRLVSKSADCLSLGSGLLMQAVGLVASARICDAVRSARERARGKAGSGGRWSLTGGTSDGGESDGGASGGGALCASVALGPLLSNALACMLLMGLRVAEAARWHGDEWSTAAMLATKLRTSFCGAVSVLGMLPAHAQAPARAGSAASAGARARGMLNLALHIALALAAMLVLTRLQAREDAVPSAGT